MDDAVTDYPSFGGLSLLSLADTEFDFVTDEQEFNTLQYGGCVQNCQDPARWMRGVIDSGVGYFFDGQAASVHTASGIAVAYDAFLPGNSVIRLATCGGGCYRRAAWSLGVIHTGFLGLDGHSRAFVVDATGTMDLLYQPASGNTYVSALSFARCAASCADSASWQTVMVDSGRFFASFALTTLPSGGMRALAMDPLTYFACDSGCLSATNWASLVLDTAVYQPFGSIVAGPDGAMHVAYRSSSQRLHYATCQSNCLSIASWSVVDLSPAVYDISLTLDAFGHPWIATSYWLESSFGPSTKILQCAAACGVAGSWNTTGIDSLGDADDIEMLVDGGGQPRVMVSGFGVHYAQRPDTTVLAVKR